jgi:hypothetical protein
MSKSLENAQVELTNDLTDLDVLTGTGSYKSVDLDSKVDYVELSNSSINNVKDSGIYQCTNMSDAPTTKNTGALYVVGHGTSVINQMWLVDDELWIRGWDGTNNNWLAWYGLKEGIADNITPYHRLDGLNGDTIDDAYNRGVYLYQNMEESDGRPPEAEPNGTLVYTGDSNTGSLTLITVTNIFGRSRIAGAWGNWDTLGSAGDHTALSGLDVPSQHPLDVVFDTSTGQPLSDVLAGKANSTHSHAWSDITDTPESYPPSSHTHDSGDLSGVPVGSWSFNPDTLTLTITIE